MRNIFGLSTAGFFKILPVVLSGLTTADSWFFVRSFYKAAAGYAAILTAVSTWLLRISIDVYASFFATFLLLFTLPLYFEYRGTIGLH